MSPKKTPSGPEGALPKLKTLYQFMQDHGLETLEIDEPDFRVKLARKSANPTPVMVPTPMTGVAPVVQAAAGAMPAAAASAPAGAVVVKSTMMGIFYRAASPSSPPFCKEGDSVKQGQVLCMVEAMKVFNEIKADFPGKVVGILVENGKPVKSGQDLFHIQRA